MLPYVPWRLIPASTSTASTDNLHGCCPIHHEKLVVVPLKRCAVQTCSDVLIFLMSTDVFTVNKMKIALIDNSSSVEECLCHQSPPDASDSCARPLARGAQRDTGPTHCEPGILKWEQVGDKSLVAMQCSQCFQYKLIFTAVYNPHHCYLVVLTLTEMLCPWLRPWMLYI